MKDRSGWKRLRLLQEFKQASEGGDVELVSGLLEKSKNLKWFAEIEKLNLIKRDEHEFSLHVVTPVTLASQPLGFPKGQSVDGVAKQLKD